MKSAVATALLAMACLQMAGCGQPAVLPPPPESLHGGVLITLPEDQGVVELLNGKPVPASGGKPGYPLVAYLLQPDRKSAAASPPKAMTVKYLAQGEEKSATLVLDPDTSDPVGSARFVSPPTPLVVERGEAGGTIEFEWNGKKVSTSFRGKQ